MPGVPATSPNLGIPRYSNGDAADFAGEVNAVVDQIDAVVAKRASPTLTGTVTLPSVVSTTATLGFFGAAPVAQPAARTLSNWSVGSNTRRTIDRNSWTELQLFDLVMTLIDDLRKLGLLA